MKGDGPFTGLSPFYVLPQKGDRHVQKSSPDQFQSGPLRQSFADIHLPQSARLKYRFHYVEKRKPERISIALPFGTAMHAALELFYRSLKAGRNKEPLNALLETFEAVLNLELEKNAGTPVVWKKNTPDKAGALAMGKSMLTAFYESIDLSGYAVVEVELPLSARLYTDDGLPTEFMLVGILDLLLMDENSEAVVVDNKTAAQPMSQDAADENLQMSAYAYLAGRQQIRVSHLSGEMPVRCAPKIEDAQAGARPHRPHRPGSETLRQDRQCCTGWYRCRHLYAPARIGCVATALTQTPVKSGKVRR